MDIRFSGRVYLRKRQYTGFNTTYGPAYYQISQNLGENPDPNRVRGYLITEPCDIRSLTLSFNASTSDDRLKWITHLVVRSADGTVKKYPTAEQQPETRDRQLVTFEFEDEDISCEAGDVVSLLFERTSTDGSSTYYLYIDIAISLRSP